MAGNLSSGGHTKNYTCNPTVPCLYGWMAAVIGPGVGANIQAQKNIEWTTEMSIKLVKIDDEE